MNIEEKIKNNRAAFDDVKMPDGGRERFLAKMQGTATSRTKRLWLAWGSVAAAVVAVIMVVTSVKPYRQISTKSLQVSDNKLVTMRQFYDEKVEEAIINLEDVMENVDDSTRMQINAVINDLLNIGNVFAEMAPLPEDRQMAITEQIYDNKLRTIELISKNIDKIPTTE